MTIELRDANENDKADILTLLAELNSALSGGATPQIDTALRQLLSKERGQITIAEEDGTLLGMATVSYNIAMRYEGEYCQLEELIVTEAARGRKLGGLLVQKIIENARDRGCAEIGLYLLERTEHNRPFYEKYGFVAVGTEMRLSLG